MSFFSKLFGGGGDDKTPAVVREEAVAYKGYLIVAAPQPAESEAWRLAGFIVSGEMEREFVRVDTVPSRTDACEFAVRKGQQIIDERGERLFADGEATGRC